MARSIAHASLLLCQKSCAAVPRAQATASDLEREAETAETSESNEEDDDEEQGEDDGDNAPGGAGA